MSVPRLLVLVLLLLALPSASKAADEADWAPGTFSPRMDDPPLPGDGLTRGQLLARADSIQLSLDGVEGKDAAPLCYQIAEAYLATDLIKHRPTALDWLDRALVADPDYFAAGRLRAATVHAMRYPGQAQRYYEQLCAEFPDRALGWYLLGGFHFTEGRRILDQERFHSAASAYSRAVAIDSTWAVARMGLASSMAALDWYADLPLILEPIVDDVGHGREARFLLACAYAALEREEEAWAQFHMALDGADEDLRTVFLYGEGFLEESEILEELASRLNPELLAAAMPRVEEGWVPADGLDAEIALEDSTVLRAATESYWRARNPNPTHISNGHELSYWRRLVEAEMLFGIPEKGIRGWQRQTGVAWVRYGRPILASYTTIGANGSSGTLAPFRLDNGIILPDPGSPVWVWGYKLGPYAFALIFEDLVMNGNWIASESTALRLRHAEKRSPVLFAEDFDEEPSLRLEISVATFHRPKGATTLETYLSIETLPSQNLMLPPSPTAEGEGEYSVEWAIFDEDEERLEYRRIEVDEAQRESVLRRELGVAPSSAALDPYLIVLPADLAPGIYRVALDVTSRLDGYHEAREIALEIRERRIEELSVSDLQLASIFQPWTGEEALRPGMLKHAFAVVPAPGGVFAPGAQELYVYYEIYNLCQDESGSTHFDVSYRVYRRKDKDHRRILTRRDVAGLDAVDPLGLTYLEETTGASPQRHVVKGGVVDLSSLEAGNYVLELSIQDRECGTRAESYAPFTKSLAAQSP